MRICVLSCVGAEIVPFEAWLPGETFEYELLDKSNSVRRIQELAASGRYDAFLNFCDGIEDGVEDAAGLEVVFTLESLGLPFTGAHSDFYRLTKEEMKRRVDQAGGVVPRGMVAFTEEDAELAAEKLPFPLIVKDFNGWGSTSLHESSRVTTKEQLLAETRRMIKERNGALIEQFIEGREFTVLVAENPSDPDDPFVVQPVEVKFAHGRTFKTYEVKWVTYMSDMAWVTVRDELLTASLKNAARIAWRACCGTGYGRVDFRVGATDGLPYFLEINANPGMFFGTDEASYGSADFCIHFDPGWSHSRFLAVILATALKDSRRPVSEFASFCNTVTPTVTPPLPAPSGAASDSDLSLPPLPTQPSPAEEAAAAAVKQVATATIA